ncbi:peptidyl-prolyl cis-trans isomerase [Erythrobacter sp. MTPC3]|uniref:peptidylprolyl isomerase n=1 Tax=Erythrobacter sp. MTPC3 TaxID=3056564 RepID=UPI0036F409C1
MTLPGWAREPLLHFLVAGGFLYAFFVWTGGIAADPASRVIDVDRPQQALLAGQFERTMGRAPTDAELDAQIEQFIRDEILYREALRLGLDQNDVVVRRRLVAKMDMAAGAAAETAQPDEETLRAFYRANPNLFAGAVLVSFDQLVFRTRGEAQAAAAALEQGAEWQSLGEASMLPQTRDAVPLNEAESVFGQVFAGALTRIEPSQDWQGPLQSGVGWHLLRLRERSSQEAAFDQIRPRVENAWRSAEIAARKDRAFAVLRGAYRIEVAE